MFKPNVLRFVGAAALGLVGLVASLPWHEIVSVQTAATIAACAGSAGAVLAFLGIKGGKS